MHCNLLFWIKLLTICVLMCYALVDKSKQKALQIWEWRIKLIITCKKIFHNTYLINIAVEEKQQVEEKLCTILRNQVFTWLCLENYFEIPLVFLRELIFTCLVSTRSSDALGSWVLTVGIFSKLLRKKNWKIKGKLLMCTFL